MSYRVANFEFGFSRDLSKEGELESFILMIKLAKYLETVDPIVVTYGLTQSMTTTNKIICTGCGTISNLSVPVLTMPFTETCGCCINSYTYQYKERFNFIVDQFANLFFEAKKDVLLRYR